MKIRGNEERHCIPWGCNIGEFSSICHHTNFTSLQFFKNSQYHKWKTYMKSIFFLLYTYCTTVITIFHTSDNYLFCVRKMCSFSWMNLDNQKLQRCSNCLYKKQEVSLLTIEEKPKSICCFFPQCNYSAAVRNKNKTPKVHVNCSW